LNSFPIHKKFVILLNKYIKNQIKYIFPTSKANKTPPIGEPKATATPAAQEADKISRILAVKQL